MKHETLIWWDSSDLFRRSCSRNGRISLIEDGAVVVESGRIVEVESWGDQTERTKDVTVVDHRPGLIVPALSTCMRTIRSQMSLLLMAHNCWIGSRFTFPEESKFSDEAYAAARRTFLDELLRNGTTVMVFCTIHPESVDALFNAASKRNMCIHASKVMMDSNCPEYLKDDVETGGRKSALISAGIDMVEIVI